METTIKASDGKVFYGMTDSYVSLLNDVKAYEANLKLKKEKEEADRKAKEEVKEYRYNQVLDKLESLNKVVESYEKETGDKLTFVIQNNKLTAMKYGDYPYMTKLDLLRGLMRL